ncbi:hypothetical protein Cgig2_007648 [Carnegiea gigantea]|uniref:Uncharacterized protein n=1 Tax=Carnegiea gigantea TaxID=171969 RepID=A0A9Q1GQ45_9CARY|nr:hypothetical protein Cgig2_007648 [Carnegiea gigantea]
MTAITYSREECWGSTSGSSYLYEDVARDSDGNVSVAEEGDVDLYSAKEMESNRRQCDQRKRVPVQQKGRYKSHRAVEDVVVIGYDFGVGVLVGLNPIIRGKVTLDIVVNFVTRSGTMHVEAIKGMTLKPILQYRLFGIRRELTPALIRRWVPHRGHSGCEEVKLLGPINKVPLNGCAILLQVWFYEHTIKFCDHAEFRFPKIAK